MRGKNNQEQICLADRIRAREVMHGIFNLSGSANMIELAAVAGFDFVIIDTEHSSYGLDHAINLVRAAESYNIVPLIRVSENRETLIMKALDFGSQGVIVPHVNCASDAIAALKAAKFPPYGTRGMCPDVRAAGYTLESWVEYAQRSRTELSIIPLIEEQTAIDNVEEIVAVDGINAVFFGPADFSVSVASSINEGFTDEVMLLALDGLKKVCQVAEKAKVAVFTTPLGNLTDPSKSFKELLDLGAKVLVSASDTMVFLEASRKIVHQARLLSRLNVE